MTGPPGLDGGQLVRVSCDQNADWHPNQPVQFGSGSQTAEQLRAKQRVLAQGGLLD